MLIYITVPFFLNKFVLIEETGMNKNVYVNNKQIHIIYLYA